MSAYKNMFSESKCLSRNQLLGYLHGKLDAEEVYTIESHLNDCELCSAAIDGLMERPEEETRQELQTMKQTWEEKWARLPQHNKESDSSLTLQTNRKNRWMIAASVVVLLGLAGFSVYSYFHHEKGMLSKKETEIPALSSKTNSDNEINQIHVTPEDLKSNENQVVKAVPSKDKQDPVSEISKTTIRREAPVAAPPAAIQASDIQSMKEEENKPESPKTQESEVIPDVAVKDEHVKRETDQAKLPEQKLLKSSSVGLSNAYKSSSSKYSPVTNQSNYAGKENYNNTNVSNYNQKKLSYEPTEVSSLQKGIQLYNSGSYRKCIKWLRKSIDQSSGQDLEDMHYYLALSYTQLEEFEEAAVHYTWLKNSSRYSAIANQALIQTKAAKAIKK